jgi:hypothetical protein
MTEEELVHGYVTGQVSRRVFIRRLIQGGITVAAAFAYADELATPAGANPGKDLHGVHHVSGSYDDHYLHHDDHRHHHHNDQPNPYMWPLTWGVPPN